MRSTVAARAFKAVAFRFALLFACGFLACGGLSIAHAAEETASAPAPLATALVESRIVTLPATDLAPAHALTVTYGVVELSTDKTEETPLPAVRTTYTARGGVYTIDREANTAALVNAANAELTAEGYLVVPSALVIDGAIYPVTSVVAGSLSGTEAPLVALSSSVASVDAAVAVQNDALRAVYVSPENDSLISYDGCLYAKEDDRPIRLLLVPEGKQGAVRIPSGAEADPETFSHCVLADAASVDAGSAVTASRNVSPYLEDKDPEAAGSSIEGEAVDYASVIVDEDAFSPIMLPSDDVEADVSAESSSVDDAQAKEDGTDSTGSSPDVAVDSTEGKQVAADQIAAQERATAFADLPSYLITFDANGGETARIPHAVRTEADASIPSLLDQRVPDRIPVRDKYVFMGFYDGSDYRQANRYYNPDFTQDGCTTVYALGEHGLVLYAGWAPVISVDVPTGVSVSVGSEPAIDSPTVTTAHIKNMSPWDVKASSLTWDIASLQGSDAKLTDLFENAASVRLSLSATDDPDRKGMVAPGATTTQPEDTDFIAIHKGSAAAPSERSFDYTLILNDASVAKTEAVSNTSLITVFEAADAPTEPVRATALFDANDNGASDYYLDAVQMTYGEMPEALTMPDGGAFAAPVYYGHTFMGFFDGPVYDAENAVQYFDANGEPTREWDKTTATVLYAGWHTDSGRVVFDANGGYFDHDPSATAKTFSVAYGSTLADALGVLPTAMVRVGRDVLYSDAWYTDPLGGERVEDPAAVTIDDVDEPIVLYAHWDGSGASVEVTFVANGQNALVEGEQRFTKSMALGQFMETLPQATRPGYSFAGWYTAAVDGIRIESAPATLVPMTLYAHWTGDTVTVSWDTGGWEAANPPSATYAYSEVDTLNTGFPSGGIYDAMSRGTGFTFRGWYAMAPDGSPVGERITAASPLPVASCTYHAFWDVTISWDANMGQTPVTTTVTVSTDAPIVMPGTDPVAAERVFLGWFTSPSGGEQVNASAVVSGPATYYAHWKVNTYQIAFDFRGGSGGTEKVEAPYGEAVPSVTPPMRPGYVFAGYWTAVNGGGKQYYGSTGASVAAWDISADTTLYAKWDPATIVLSWNSEGGSAVDSTSVVYAPTAKVLMPSVNPMRAGFTFKGWFTAVSGGVEVTADTALPEFSTVYHAQWTANTINLAWNSEGGSTVADTQQIYAIDAKVVLPAAPVRAGYTFAGWYTAAVNGTSVTADTALPAADATYHAHWIANTITITWDSQGGSAVANTSAIYSASAKVPMPDADPTKVGYVFDGWFAAVSAGDQVTSDTDLPAENATYYAYWTPKVSALTFNLNGGEGTTPVGIVATYDAAMPTIAGAPTREGYTFRGYYDAASGGTQYYTAALVSACNWNKDTTGETILYAQWKYDFAPSSSVPSGADGDFYLQLSASQASAVSSSDLTMTAGYYGASLIKKAANSIASEGTASIYYPVFQKIMNNDYKFKGKWKNVSANNANSVLTTTTTYDIRLIGLRQDYTNTAKTTFAGMTFQFADNTLAGVYRANNDNSNSTGWRNSELRARMNSTNSTDCSPQPSLAYGDAAARQSIWSRATSGITSSIQPVYKFTHNAVGNTSTAVSATRDQMFLASYWEMASTGNAFTTYPWVTNETVAGTQYQYWKAKAIKGSGSNASLVKKVTNYAGTAESQNNWWVRTVLPGNTSQFLRVESAGDISYGWLTYTPAGVAPCFCF